MPNWRKLVVSGSDASFSSLNVSNAITASIVSASQFTGSLFGTATTASYVKLLQGPNITINYQSDGIAISGSAGGSGNPGGSDRTIQFNSASVFSGSGNLKYDYVNNNILLTGSLLVTQSHISTVDYIDYAINPGTPAHLEGRTHWIDDTKTLQIDTDVNNFMIEVGHQNVVRVRNTTGFDLAAGKIVYINGESGNRPTVTTASWDGDPTSAATLGFVAQQINNNQNGYVITNGMLRGINTNAFAPGTQLYLSSSGDYTSTVPVSPKHEVRLGKTITQATSGVIYVDIMNGYELDELHNVLINSSTNGDLLVKSGSLWINSKQLTGSYGLTGSLQATSFTGSLLGTASYVSGNIFDTNNPALTSSYSLSTLVGGGTNAIQVNNNNILYGDESVFAFDLGLGAFYHGSSITAAGAYSHAEGDSTQAIGSFSHAEGAGAQAIGSSSHAEGTSTQAIGDHSHAEGDSTQAIGDHSHAEGRGTTAIGDYSHAEGRSTTTGINNAYSASIVNGIVTLSNSYGPIGDFTSNDYCIVYDGISSKGYLVSQSYFSSPNTIVELYDTAVNESPAYVFAIKVYPAVYVPPQGDQTIPGYGSHAEGHFTEAIGDYSHAEGISKAIGLYSHAEGKNARAIGAFSHAEGGSTNREGGTAIGEGSHAEGGFTQAIGENSHAEGYFTEAIGGYSHAEGSSTKAIGGYSHAEGTGTKAIGVWSHAEGYNTQAIGDGSHAEGFNTRASGSFSHAEGSGSIAIGSGSHAEGFGTATSGDYSHAEGLGTIALGPYQHVQGRYNISSSAQSAFIIGNGADDNNRSNLVFASGSVFVISGSLRISGSIQISGLVGTADLNFGAAPGTNTATVTVANTNVTNNSFINIYIMSTSSVDHNAEDHKILALYSKVTPENIIDNTSFDIAGVTDLRVNGIFKVKYIINN